MAPSKEIPPGLSHIALISRINAANRKESDAFLRGQESDLRVLGSSLSALYLAATCQRKCWGGDHILEALAARIYNLASASYSLISVGYYDESLSLVRSIGEIANLLSLSVHDKPKFVEWIKSSKQERIAKFGPAKVRKLLAKSGNVLMDDQWYSDLCESYTHVTPFTRPNSFNEENRSIVGGIVQQKGIENSVEQLTNVVAMVALYYCRYFKLDDYFDRIIEEAGLES